MVILRILKLSELEFSENKLINYKIKAVNEIYEGSNRVFLCELESEKQTFLSVYKPLRGETVSYTHLTLPTNREV